MTFLGIDIGGTGIKGAPVNVETGELQAERHRLLTPQPVVPATVAQVVAQIVSYFDWKGGIGYTFPAVVKKGVAYSAANIDASWIHTNVQEVFQQHTGCPAAIINDADAAGIAEMRFGAGREQQGVVMVLTVGTGIGSAVFVNGHLMPNTELGHLEIRGKEAEHRASDRVRVLKEMSWARWAEKFNEYLARLEALFSPDLFILGGGISSKHDKFLHLLQAQAPIVPARFLNNAGIVGAALAAYEQQQGWLP